MEGGVGPGTPRVVVWGMEQIHQRVWTSTVVKTSYRAEDAQGWQEAPHPEGLWKFPWQWGSRLRTLMWQVPYTNSAFPPFAGLLLGSPQQPREVCKRGISNPIWKRETEVLGGIILFPSCHTMASGAGGSASHLKENSTWEAAVGPFLSSSGEKGWYPCLVGGAFSLCIFRLQRRPACSVPHSSGQAQSPETKPDSQRQSWMAGSLFPFLTPKGCKCRVQFADPNSPSKGVSQAHAGEGEKSTHNVRDSNPVLASHVRIRSCW